MNARRALPIGRPRSWRDRRLVQILLVWACNVIALLILDVVIGGVRIEPEWRAIPAGAVFGIVNWLVKPIIKLLALPLIVVTLGIALFFVNLLVLYITSWLSPGFDIESFGSAVGATILLWIVNVALQSLFGIGNRRRS